MSSEHNPINAEEIEAQAVEFLWRDRVPKGMMTIVAGRPDQGKGLFASHVAAEVSKRGKRVLYSAAEDSHAIMTKPRLEAAGAVLSNIMLWRFQLPAQMAELEQIVVREGIELIVMDPVASHLSHGVSRHSDNIRVVTDPLARLLEATGCACLMVEHALKRVPSGGHVLNAIGGNSSGLTAAARAAFVFGIDPADEDQRVLCFAKFNIGEKPAALTFDLDTEDLSTVSNIPFLIAGEEIAFDGMRLFETNAKKNGSGVGRPPDKRAAAAEWLTNYLASNGATRSGDVVEDAKQSGMTVKTLRRAAEDMAVVKNPPGGGRNCTWDLPDELKDVLGIGEDVGADDAEATSTTTDGQPVEEAEFADQVAPHLDQLDTDEVGEEITDDDIAQLLGNADAQAEEDGDDA